MKKFVFAFVLCALAMSCQEDEPQSEQKGCLTAILKGDTERVTIRCCTQAEFGAGSNVKAGGTASWSMYESHQWKPVNNCDECE